MKSWQEKDKEISVIFNKTYGHHGVFDPIPNMTIAVPYERTTYECPTCRQPYSGRRLDEHNCQPHLYYFKKTKKNPKSDRYLYRCLNVDCHQMVRLYHTRSHYESHLGQGLEKLRWEFDEQNYSTFDASHQPSEHKNVQEFEAPELPIQPIPVRKLWF